MRYIVRKMPDYVLDESFKQIDNLEVAYAGNAMDTFLYSLRLSDGEAHVNLEDDVILCDNFIEKIESIIAEHPNDLISFFTLREKSVNKDGLTKMNGGSFCMAQCVYYPKGWANGLFEFYQNWDRLAEHPSGLDYLAADFMKSKGAHYYIYQPSLVQHREGKSRIDERRSTKRQSKTFRK